MAFFKAGQSSTLFSARQPMEVFLLSRQVMRITRRPLLLKVNAGIPGKSLVQHQQFYGLTLSVSIPASGSVQYRIRVRPALPSFGQEALFNVILCRNQKPLKMVFCSSCDTVPLKCE